MVRRGHVPLRRCAGCDARDPKASLVRVVVQDGSVVTDRRGTVPGRGAYVHRDAVCIETAIARGGLARGLRAGVTQDAAGRLRGLSSEEHG